MKKVYPLAVVVILIAAVVAVHAQTNTNDKHIAAVKSDKTTVSNEKQDTTPAKQTAPADEQTSDNTQSSQTTTNTTGTTSTPKKTKSTPAVLASSTPVTHVVIPPQGPITIPTPPVTVPTEPTTPTDPGTPAPVLVAPTVAITAPAANATVSGAQNVTVNASDDKAVASVHFLVDGTEGAVTTTAPYSFAWDTTKLTNGTHTLTATAVDSDLLSTTSAPVTVTVNNQTTTPVPPVIGDNLIANPTVETDTTGWSSDGYGTNDRAFTYENDGHTGTHSLKVTMTTHPDEGDGKWFFAPVTVSGGQMYKYSNWYKSNVSTEVDVMVNFADGTTQYYYLTGAAASANWAQVNGTFTVPVNATSMSIYQTMAAVGYLQTDDFSLTHYTPIGLNRAIVSLTFDDGWRSIYTNGLPLLQKYGFTSTQYLLTSTIDYPDYMTQAMMQAFKDQGSEIAAHTVNHCDLTGVQSDDPTVCPTPISETQVNSELQNSKSTLESWFGTPVTDFATPYGAYNAQVIADIKAAGYTSHRSTDVGYNSLDTFNPYNIKVQNMTSATTLADVQGWIDQAIANKEWLVIVYHEVADTSASEDSTYSVTPANLDAQLAYIKQTGVAVENVSQALQEILPQAAAMTTAP